MTLLRFAELRYQQDGRSQQTFRRIIEIGVLAKAGSIHPGEDNGLTDNLGILLTTGLVDQLLRVFLV